MLRKENSTKEYCEETYRVCAKICRDVLKSFHPTQLEGVTYLKLKKLEDNSLIDNKNKLVSLLGHIKMKLNDSFGYFYMLLIEIVKVHSKYPKKQKRLAGILSPNKDLKAKYISPIIMEKMLELINYWVVNEILQPVIYILRIIKYQILIAPDCIASILDSKPQIFKIFLGLCIDSNESLARSAANLIFLILQRIESKTHTELYIMSAIFDMLKSGEGKVMNALHLNLLQLLSAALDFCNEQSIRQLPLSIELNHLSQIMKNSADFILTKVRFINSTILYVFYLTK